MNPAQSMALFIPIILANTQAREEEYFRLEWKLAVDRSHLMADKFRDWPWSRLNDDLATRAVAERVAKLQTWGTVPGKSGSTSTSTVNVDPVRAVIRKVTHATLSRWVGPCVRRQARHERRF